jgi:hypothetical protein
MVRVRQCLVRPIIVQRLSLGLAGQIYNRGVKSFLVASLCALAVCAPAWAKIDVSIHAGDRAPAVGQRVPFVVRSAQALDFNLRLIAVAPGQPVFRVVATITGDTSYPDPNVRRHGFEIKVKRIAPNRWRGVARFRTPGRWRVVVPNEAPAGVMMPRGAALLALSVG